VTPGAKGSYSYTVTGTGANTETSTPVTVSVVDPFCTVTASPANIALGQSSTLTAACHPAATAYAWKDGADGSICTDSATCAVTPSATGSPTYTVTGTVEGSPVLSGPVTVTVAPPSCSLTANPASISLGQSTTLTASCTPAATSYDWGGVCATGASNTCVATPSVAGTASYTVTGTVSGNPVVSPAVNVSVSAQQCAVGAVTWEAGLAAYGGNGGTPLQSISAGQMQAFSLPIGSRTANYIKIAYAQCSLEFSISKSPSACEFSADLFTKKCYKSGIDPKILAQTSDQTLVDGACVLEPNQTYYLNVRAGSTASNCTYYLAW
jgi:hypothetical protein